MRDSFGQVKDSPVAFSVGTTAQLRAIQQQFRFPIRGPHNYGSTGSRFGSARSGHSHQGQDVFASCGTKLVAIHTGRVKAAGYQGSAGNYVVIDADGVKQDHVYMHLQSAPRVSAGPARHDGPAARQGGADRQRPGLPPPLRGLDGQWLVLGRQPDRPPGPAALLGQLLVGGVGAPAAPRPI